MEVRAGVFQEAGGPRVLPSLSLPRRWARPAREPRCRCGRRRASIRAAPGADLGSESHTQPTRQPGGGLGPGDGDAFAPAPDDSPRASPDGDAFPVSRKPLVEVPCLSHQPSVYSVGPSEVSEGDAARRGSCAVTGRKGLDAVERNRPGKSPQEQQACDGVRAALRERGGVRGSGGRAETGRVCRDGVRAGGGPSPASPKPTRPPPSARRAISLGPRSCRPRGTGPAPGGGLLGAASPCLADDRPGAGCGSSRVLASAGLGLRAGPRTTALNSPNAGCCRSSVRRGSDSRRSRHATRGQRCSRTDLGAACGRRGPDAPALHVWALRATAPPLGPMEPQGFLKLG